MSSTCCARAPTDHAMSADRTTSPRFIPTPLLPVTPPSMYGGGALYRVARKALEPKHPDIMATATDFHEVCHDLADHAAELVAVPGEARGDADVRVLRQHIDNEMLVRAIGEQA